MARSELSGRCGEFGVHLTLHFIRERFAPRGQALTRRNGRKGFNGADFLKHRARQVQMLVMRPLEGGRPYSQRANEAGEPLEYGPHTGLGAIDDSEAGRLLDVSPEIVEQLKKKPWEERPDSTHLPAELRKHPMPQSTYDEFARARPRRVANGYGAGTVLEEQPGPYQIGGSRIWFGKTFYDGEGTSGVGGLGYFDTMTSQYGFLQVPGLVDWSVSAILIEEDAAWIGLVGHPEGEDYGGGLIRYDFTSGTSRRFLTKEVILHIVRWKDRVYVATRNGAYVVKENKLVKRYRVEPDIDNRFILVSENLPPNP